MKETLPPIITDWIAQMNNKQNPESVRYNYFSMLSNVKNEILKEVTKFETAFISKSKKLTNRNR